MTTLGAKLRQRSGSTQAPPASPSSSGSSHQLAAPFANAVDICVAMRRRCRSRSGRREERSWHEKGGPRAALLRLRGTRRTFAGIVPVNVRRVELLQLDAGASLLELALELVALVALDALLDCLRRLVDERLRLLETQAGRRADDLDDLDLLVAGAGQDDVDRGRLLLGSGAVGAAGARRGSGGCDCCRGDAELLLESLDALGELSHRNALELLNPILRAGCHQLSPSSFEVSSACSGAGIGWFGISSAAPGSGASAGAEGVSSAPTASAADGSGSASAAGASAAGASGSAAAAGSASAVGASASAAGASASAAGSASAVGASASAAGASASA